MIDDDLLEASKVIWRFAPSNIFVINIAKDMNEQKKVAAFWVNFWMKRKHFGKNKLILVKI